MSRGDTPATALAVDLGRTAYREALALQRRLHAVRCAGRVDDLLVLTEHEPVLTLGRRADSRHVRVPPLVLAARGIEVVPTERGGDVTYHGPGQLVAYPILDLRRRGCDVRRYVWELEQSAIQFLRRYGVQAARRPGTPGVWVGERKIASVGVYVSRWVTMHGVALNLAPALEDFDLIHPCGLIGVHMTSVAQMTGSAPEMKLAVRQFDEDFASVFGLEVRKAALPRIARAPERAPTPGPGPAHE
jgi:lipoate-protein ligase B